MNRSWLIALASTVLLSAAVAFELRGLWWAEEGPSATPGAVAPSGAGGPDASPVRQRPADVLPPASSGISPAAETSPAVQTSPAAQTYRGKSRFRQIAAVTRLPQVEGGEPQHKHSPAVVALPDPTPAEDIPTPTAMDAPAIRPGKGATEILRPGGDDSAPSLPVPTAEGRPPFDPPLMPQRLPPTQTVSAKTAQPDSPVDSPQPPIERLPGIEGPPLGRRPPAVEDLPLTPPSSSTQTPAGVRNVGAWWASLVPQPQRDDSEPRPLDIATLIHETILHSEHVQAVSLSAQVAETEIVQADAAFDPTAFIDSKWIDASDPVGNVLTTGGPPRLSREEWSSSIGFRRKTRTGGELEVAQRLVGEDNNSIFFVPANQATSQLTVSLNQPLLRGGGYAFNRSLVLLAMHDTQIARDRFRSELETQVLRVVREYWELYYQRAVLLQQRAALRESQEILDVIKARSRFDSLDSQVQRVRATVAIRHVHIIRAQAAMRNAESRLRALSNSPLLGGVSVELLPVEPPLQERITLPMEEARTLALANRTEVDAALTRVRAAGVELGISRSEMLPTLSLVLESYVSGLEGNFALAESLGEQFSEGAPSYTAGLLFEVPLGRRRAKAFHRQKVLELRQAEHIFRDTVATLSSDVEIALREVETTWQELVARRESAEATRAEVDYLRARLDHIPGEDNRAVSFLMEDLLNAIDRLVRDESELAAAQRNYAVSIAEFHRATGMLVAVEAPCP